MNLISTIQQLTPLSNEAVEWLSEKIDYFSFKKNECILPYGKICNYLYFIQAGMLGAYYESEAHEVCNWISMEGDFATSYYSFITRKPSYETIECFESCEVEGIHYSTLHEMYQRFPESERAGRLIMEEYYARLEERLISLQFKSAKERYQQLMENRPAIIQQAPLGRIASYLGMKQETLSRIRAGK
jgi:CRP-like cAMP-binding protein